MKTAVATRFRCGPPLTNLTCCRQRFKISVGCYDVKPIVSATVTLDCDTTESSMPLPVLMKS